MLDKKYINKLLKLLEKEYPEPETALIFKNEFELLIATILSAQSTDKTVNKVTEALFKKYNSPVDYLNVPENELQQDIKSTGFYKNKTKSIRGCCKMLVDRFNGKVPRDIDDLVQLPGVGRKTANVVLGNYFNVPGIVVDTHVKRLSYRLGLTKNKNPDKIEKDLNKIIPEDEWILFSNRLIWHGRQFCTARNPDCGNCPLNKICPSAFKVKS